MYMGTSGAEASALDSIIDQVSGDIVLRLDTDGFIIEASANLAQTGHDLDQMLIRPHLCDLVSARDARTVGQYLKDAMAGVDASHWVPFTMASARAEGEGENLVHQGEGVRDFALSLSVLRDDAGQATGAVALLRCVSHLRALEGEIAKRSRNDPLTGLPNRHAFTGSLRRNLARNTGGVMALLEIDKMRSISLQHGQRTTDEIIWGFGQFLEAMRLEGQELAYLERERFAVLWPERDCAAARGWLRDVLDTFAVLAVDGSGKLPALTASAGLTAIKRDVDWTFKEAELNLVLARARGGMHFVGCQCARGDGLAF